MMQAAGWLDVPNEKKNASLSGLVSHVRFQCLVLQSRKHKNHY